MRYIDKQKSILVFGGWTLKAMRLKQFFGIASTTLLLIIWQTFPVNISGLFTNSPVVAQTSELQKNEAKRLFLQGVQQNSNNQFSAAIQTLQQALSIYREIKERNGEAWTLRYLGKVYYHLKDYAKAIAYYQQCLLIAQEMKNLGLQTWVRYDLAEVQSQINPRVAQADRLRSQGWQQYKANQFATALQLWQQALSIYQETKERQGEGLMLRDLGNAYNSLGNYPKAIEYHQQYLVLTREIEDRLSEGFALWYLGNAYNSLRDYTKANDYYQQSLVIARETKNSLLEGLVQKSLVETQN